MAEITSAKIYVSDRNFIESIKRKLKLNSNPDAISSLVKLFKQNKLHLDLK